MTNPKFQIPNKFQIQISKLILEFLIWNIGACLEFGVWSLEFHPNQFSDKVKFEQGLDELMNPCSFVYFHPGKG